MPTPAAPPSGAPTDAELDALTDRASALARDVASPPQRRFRDAHAATARFQVNPATWGLAGRVLLVLPTRTE